MSRFQNQRNALEQQKVKDKVDRFFIPFSHYIERCMIITIILLVICSCITQLFIYSNERHQALVNKAIQYEGVFVDDPIEAKATLQQK